MRFLSQYWLPVVPLLCQGCAGTLATDPLAASGGPGDSGTPRASSAAIASDAAATGGGTAAVANLNLGAAYLRQGRLTLALERLDRALEQDPRLAEAHSAIATVYDRLGDTEQARNHHRRALRLAPDDPATANSFGVFLCRHAHWNDAEPLFLRAAGNPRYHTPEVALTNAGICARNAGDGATAARYLRDALARNPVYADGLFNLAALAYANNELDEARRLLDRHSETAPDSAQSAWLCFQVETGLGNRDNAQRCASMLREQYAESLETAQLERWNDGRTP